jgi:hypothetical protein
LNKTVYQTNRKNLYLINIISYSDESYINAINEDCNKTYKKVSLEKVHQNWVIEVSNLNVFGLNVNMKLILEAI